MISPLTGDNATLKHEPRCLEYRGKEYPYIAQFYEDDTTGERFTTTELDETNISQIYNQYRVEHSIPFVDEIISLRKKYGLSSSKMSTILGFGANQYRQYEDGYVPTESNGKILKACQTPVVFRTMVENSRGQLGEKSYVKIMAKIEAVQNGTDDSKTKLIYGTYGRNIANGFAPQTVDRLHNILLYFINACNGVFYTKMNKLLFFSDFCHYRKYGMGITGLAYRAIQYGPVPVRWDRVYSLFDDIQQDIVSLGNEVSGARLVSSSLPNVSSLSATEKETLNLVITRLGQSSAAHLSALSHEEKAGKDYVNTTSLIDYSTAFDLKAV